METRRRHAGKDKFRWNSVPLPLMELIIEKLDGFSGNGSLASMRLVSKSWLAAVTAYPGLLSDVEVEKASDMKNLRKIMPNVVGLELSCNNKINLQPLSALSKLTYLSLTGQYPSREDEGELQANLSVLPKSLDTLRLKSVYVLPKCLTRLKCVDLRSLVFCFGRNKTAEVLELLQCFPQLEELQIGSTMEADRNFEGLFQSNRCRALKRVALSEVVLVDCVTECVCPPRLQELYCLGVIMSSEWLNRFTSSASSLRSIQIKASSCFVVGTHFNPLSTLSSLVLETVDFYIFIRLGSGDLKSLSLLVPIYEYPSPILPQLSRLTGLTRLELVEFNAQHCLSSLRTLPLQELVLVNCQEFELKLFAANAQYALTTTLRKLHIEEVSYAGERQAREIRQPHLEEVGQAVFQLPGLHQVSGGCDLFAIGMSQGLENWGEADLVQGTMVTYSEFHYLPVAQMKTWTKPES